MTVPVWALLAFALWTLLLLLSTVGVYRWRRVLTGLTPIKDFRADKVEGADWYQRSMRAHANCVENLPVFAAIVFALHASQLGGAGINALTVAVVVARVLQSLVHVGFTQTNKIASLRFTLFFIQIVCFVALIARVILRGASA